MKNLKSFQEFNEARLGPGRTTLINDEDVEPYIGRRVKCISMKDDPDPVPPGTLGTVVHFNGLGDIEVKWDNGRKLTLIPGVDEFEFVARDSSEEIADANMFNESFDDEYIDDDYFDDYHTTNLNKVIDYEDKFVGRRIRCIEMKNDPTVQIDSGEMGTITDITDEGYINVKWDNGEIEYLIPGVDRYEITPKDSSEEIADANMFNESLVSKNITKGTEWKQLEGDTLPESAIEFCKEGEVFKYPGNWLEAFYKGDINTTKDWIIITDNGGFYKVNAELGIWFRSTAPLFGKESNIGLQCIWSVSALRKSLKSLFQTGTIVRDPGYQT